MAMPADMSDTPRAEPLPTYCPACGYPLVGHTPPCTCPECAFDISADEIEQYRRQTRFGRRFPLALIMAFVFAIASRVLSGFVLIRLVDVEVGYYSIWIAVGSGLACVLPIRRAQQPVQYAVATLWLWILPLLHAGWMLVVALLTVFSYFDLVEGFYALVPFCLVSPVLGLAVWRNVYEQLRLPAGIEHLRRIHNWLTLLAILVTGATIIWAGVHVMYALGAIA